MAGQSSIQAFGSRIVVLAAIVVAVTGLVVWLSLSATQAVSVRADRLVATDVPRLRTFGALQDAIHRRTLTLYLYYATAEPEPWQDSEGVRAGFSEHLERLQALGLPAAELDALYTSIARFDQHALAFHEEMAMGASRSWDTLRLHLANAQLTSDELNEVLMRWSEEIRRSAGEGGTQTLAELSKLNRNQLGLAVVTAIVALFVLAITRGRLKDQDALYRRAYFSPLTGLPNIRRLEADWASAKSTSRAAPCGLLVMSLDRYRMITGTYGHAFAELLLKEIADRFSSVLHDCGGEAQIYQFTQASWLVVLSSARDHEDSRETLDALLHACRVPVSIDGRELAVSCSVGASYYPDHGGSLEDLLRNCDSSLTEAQKLGGGHCAVFNAEMVHRAERFLSLEQALRTALDKGELELFLQPKVGSTTLDCLGAEALLRWRRDGQLVSPGEFIPVAEESGLIVPIGQWVIEEACRLWREFCDGGAPPIQLAVNVSAQQFQAPGFVHHLEATLAKFAVPPVMLELEITEEATFGDEEQVAETLRALRLVGVRIAIDDFGTGYSSLAYLTTFPIDVLKIDQRFVQNIDTSKRDESVISTIAAMARQLGFETVAEGVETERQAQLVRELGCEYLQGYLYSPPLPAREFLAFLDQHEPRGLAEKTRNKAVSAPPPRPELRALSDP